MILGPSHWSLVTNLISKIRGLPKLFCVRIFSNRTTVFDGFHTFHVFPSDNFVLLKLLSTTLPCAVRPVALENLKFIINKLARGYDNHKN